MVTTPRTKPPPETQRIYDRNTSVGMLFKAMHDAKAPNEGVTKLDSITALIWDKSVRRYRYTYGMKTLTGTRLGGRFAPAPNNAPPERKKGYKNKKMRSRK